MQLGFDKHIYEKICGLHIRHDDKNALSKDLNANMVTDRV